MREYESPSAISYPIAYANPNDTLSMKRVEDGRESVCYGLMPL